MARTLYDKQFGHRVLLVGKVSDCWLIGGKPVRFLARALRPRKDVLVIEFVVLGLWVFFGFVLPTRS